MKALFLILFVAVAASAQSQSIAGRWQLSETKTCFQTDAQMKESDTEKELAAAMSESSSTAVARIMELDEKGNGEEGVMSTGKKKGSSKETFKYKVAGSPASEVGEFQKVDKKSGLVTSRWVIDELTESTLVMHDALRDCETKSYIKIK